MRKSPFSTPRGNRGQNGFDWKASGGRRGGYGPPRNNFDHSGGNQEASEDFIPFQSSQSFQQERPQSFGRGGRNRGFSGSPAFYGNPGFRGNFNNSFSPYKRDGRPPRGGFKNFQRTSNREIPIAAYVDLDSFLEDPWKQLVDDYNKTKINDSGLGNDNSNTTLDLDTAQHGSTVEENMAQDPSSVCETDVSPESESSLAAGNG